MQSLNKMFKDKATSMLDTYQTSIFWREIKNFEGYANSKEFVCKVSLPITNMVNF